jgi:hypothetical protein
MGASLTLTDRGRLWSGREEGLQPPALGMGWMVEKSENDKPSRAYLSLKGGGNVWHRPGRE